MNIEARKIEFLKEFLKIQSEELIARLENIVMGNNEELKRFSVGEFNERIDKSLNDSENDSGIDSNELLAEIKQWQ